MPITPQPDSTPGPAAIDRVEAYLNRLGEITGLDPETIHRLDGRGPELTVSDLRALIAEARQSRGTVEWGVDGPSGVATYGPLDTQQAGAREVVARDPERLTLVRRTITAWTEAE